MPHQDHIEFNLTNNRQSTCITPTVFIVNLEKVNADRAESGQSDFKANFDFFSKLKLIT